ncbi:hypothetical protein DIS17_04215 [Levilactobacillus brevis]|uniref:ATPase AAA-type core domain-containing protein n=2 Tax=Levilactobacillus brevis TaxID=1580 RepID=A0AAJ5K5N6_LEVBR|nr:hypothetical protein DIS17_04215 [Levilactobacillus brevis]
MKLLRVRIEGLKMFEDLFDFSFITKQNVTRLNSTSVHNIFNRIHAMNVVALIGKNASGKTMELNLLIFVFRAFLHNQPLNHIDSKYALVGDEFLFKTNYFDEVHNMLYELHSKIIKNEDGELIFEEETIYSKKLTIKANKSNIFDLNDDSHVNVERRPANSLLPEDNTYFRSITKKDNVELTRVFDFSAFNNMNLLFSEMMDSYDTELQSAIITYLDPTIEYVHAFNQSPDSENKNDLLEVKFKRSDKVVRVNGIKIFNYLSAGTIKGVNLFNYAFNALRSGGFLIIDEIENHFHRAIVQTIISFFSDPRINKTHATLIFTTHYPQLLDTFDRNDDIYVSRRVDDKTYLDRFCDQIRREDIKKSDIYESGVLNGTSPMFEAYDKLRSVAVKVATVTDRDMARKDGHK